MRQRQRFERRTVAVGLGQLASAEFGHQSAPLLLGVGLAVGHELAELAPPLVPAPHPATRPRRPATLHRQRREPLHRSQTCRAVRPGAPAARCRRERADDDRETDAKCARDAGHLRRDEGLLRAAFGGIGASRTMLTTPPAAPASTVGKARIAAGSDGRESCRAVTTAPTAATDSERDQCDCRGDEVPYEKLAALDRQAVGAVGLIDLLRQRFHRLQTQQEQHERGADQRRRRAADHHRLEDAGHCRERGHAHQSRDAGSGRRWQCRVVGIGWVIQRRHPQPRPAARVLLVQLPSKQDDGAQVLHRDGEPQLGDEAAAPGEGVERRVLQHADADEQHDQRDQWRDEIDRVLSPSPHGQASVDVGRARDVPRQRGALPDDAGQTHRRGDPQRQPDRVGDQRSPGPQAARWRCRTTAPLAAQATGVPGKPSAGQLADDRARAPRRAMRALRARWLTGRSSARMRSTGDSMTYVTSGASSASGPPCAPLRSAAMKASAVIIPISAGPFLATSATASAPTRRRRRSSC